MRVGVWFYGLATVATGILDIVWGDFEASHQPINSIGQHVPGQQVLAYIAGVWLAAAGMAILWRRTARMGAAGSAMIYLVFAYSGCPGSIPRLMCLVFESMSWFSSWVGSLHRYSWSLQQHSSTPGLHRLIRYGEREHLSPVVGCWDSLPWPSA
jgi:uncharacterized membrane protein YphA (DoxX/SURF4 family)